MPTAWGGIKSEEHVQSANCKPNGIEMRDFVTVEVSNAESVISIFATKGLGKQCPLRAYELSDHI